MDFRNTTARGRCMTQTRESDQRGFTLLEILVVIAILGLLIGYMWQLLRPDRHKFDETAAEDELERRRAELARAKSAGGQ